MARKSRVRPEVIRDRTRSVLVLMDQTDPEIASLGLWLTVKISRNEITRALEGDVEATTRICLHVCGYGKLPVGWLEDHAIAEALDWIRKTRYVTGSRKI
jgi:hypothetical protein